MCNDVCNSCVVYKVMKSYSISQRNKSRGSKVWYGRTFEGGVLIREESLKTTSRMDAKAWLDMKNASRFNPGLDPDNNVGIVKAINDYMDYNSSRVSDKYMESLRVNVRNKFVPWCKANGKEDVGSITRSDADMYYESMASLRDSTKRVLITSVRTFFQWAIERYDLSMKNPFDGIKMGRAVKRAKAFWTDEQIDAILDHSGSPEERCFFAVMAFAGLRHFEAAKFGKSMLEDGNIHVIGKFSKEAFIPVSDRLLEELSRIEIADGMFERFSDNDVANRCVRKTVVAAGMDASDATCHKFRHSFISNLCRHGVDVKSVQMLARHEDVSLTLNTYSHLLQSDLKDAINTKKEG